MKATPLEEKKKRTKKEKAAHVIAIVLFVSLVLSVIYSLVRFILAPEAPPTDGPYVKIKSDYLLMLFQCVMGIAVMLLPSLLAHKWSITLSSGVTILYYLFLYCAIYLGEVRQFYYRIPHWDSMLHAFSGAMLGALGFVLVDLLNRDRHVRVSLSPFFVSAFAFCFALAVGALWEIYEFSFDKLLGLNMQKHTTAEGVPLSGAEALADTMKDIIIDAVAAFDVSLFGFLTYRREGQRRQSAGTAPADAASPDTPVHAEDVLAAEPAASSEKEHAPRS